MQQVSVKGKVRLSVKTSWKEGVFTSAMIGLVETCLSPLAMAMNATPAQIATLGSLPNMVSALVQSQTHTLMEWFRSRKKTLQVIVYLQAVTLFSVGILAFFSKSERVIAVIGLAIFYVTLGSMASPMWGSLLCEYLPPRQRSSFFGRRSQILGLIVISVGLIAGLFLQKFQKNPLPIFGLIFLTAAFFRWMSWFYLGKVFDPQHDWGNAERRKGIRFEPEARDNFFRFLVFNSVMMFGVQIAGPLQAVYLLRDLKVSYLTYMILICGSNFTMFYMMASWGRHADLSGNLKVIRAVSWAMPLLPLLWLVSFNPLYLLAVQLASGVVWSGYNLCITNFIYDAAPASERVRATTLFNMNNGIAIFLGALLGGQLIDVLPPFRGYVYLSLCLVSALIRCAAVIFLFPRIKEVRHVQRVRSMDLFYSVVGLKPIPGIAPGPLRRWLLS